MVIKKNGHKKEESTESKSQKEGNCSEMLQKKKRRNFLQKNRPKEEIYICAVPRIHRALFHDRVDVYFAGTGSTQYAVVPDLALALVVAPTTDAGGVFFVAVATNIFLSKEKQKRKNKKIPRKRKKTMQK